MKGRKPKPTALKIVNGNPGHRPLNDAEPKPDPAIPDAPDHLGTEAKAEWQRLTAELHAIGMLTQLDRGALAAYCLAWGRWVVAERMVTKLGMMLRSKTTGVLYANPYLHVANRAMEQLTRLGPLFGLDPSSRTRLKVPAPEPEGDPLDELVNRANARHA